MNRSIRFAEPTSRAMGRMTTILFRPFDFGKWFVLGFTAFLATLSDSGGNSYNGGGGGGGDGEEPDLEEVYRGVSDFVTDNLSWILPLAIALVFVILAIWVVFLWLSSRGKFMFLDNVVHNRALVKAPWAEFRAAGNSLFKWLLVFTLIVWLVFLVVFGGAGWLLFTSFSPEGPLGGDWIAGLVTTGIVFLLAMLAVGYISVLLQDFVVPVMYKHSLTTTQAWGRVLELHSARTGTFILYVLWRALLGLLSFVAILIVGFGTCCIGFIIMAIPYLGSVLLLPITVFFRGLGPEFIRQFGEEFDLWEGSADNFSFSPGDQPGTA